MLLGMETKLFTIDNDYMIFKLQNNNISLESNT